MDSSSVFVIKSISSFSDRLCDLLDELSYSYDYNYFKDFKYTDVKENIKVVIFFYDIRFDMEKEISRLKILYRDIVFICVSLNTPSIDDQTFLVNDLGVYAMVPKEQMTEKVPGILKQALADIESFESQSAFRAKLLKQNSELQDLTDNLEKIVTLRTSDLSELKQKTEKQIQKTRKINKFVNDLTHVQDVEDLMATIRMELKSFHRLHLPILNYADINNKNKIVSFQGQQVLHTDCQYLLSSDKNIRVDQIDDQQFLANLFKRPFGKVIAIPIYLHLENSIGVIPTLYFEQDFNELEVNEFLSYMTDRIQPIATTLERVLLENEMTQAAYLWEKTFDGIKSPISIVDVDYNVLRSNSYFAEQFEASKCYEDFAGQTNVCDNCHMYEAIQSSTQKDSQVNILNKTYKLNSYPIVFDNKDHATTTVNHYQDITQKLEVQSSIVQGEKMAAIGHLASHITHELNNPLTGIASLAQYLIEEQKDNQTLVNDLKEIESATLRSQKIIKNLLEFSNDTSDTKTTQSLNSMVDKTLPLLKTAMGPYKKNIQLEAEQDSIHVEPQLFQQVVFNIINNACQAMGKKGEITIESFNQDNMICLSIEDSGPGIPPEIQSKIFDAFFTTKQKGKGTGLGLSMCQKIIHSYKGTISLDSELGHGAKFTICLPVMKE